MSLSGSREYRREGKQQTVSGICVEVLAHSNHCEQEHCFRGKDLQLQIFQDIFATRLPIDTAECE
jgi:hypothetical protein